jgi:NDP-sugar pyrophosphorylase family protein
VAVYVADNNQYNILKQSDGNEFKVLSFRLRPIQLSRPVNILLVVVAYCPPSLCKDSKKSKQFVKYIISSADALIQKYSIAGLFIIGEFNTIRTDKFAKHLNLVKTR